MTSPITMTQSPRRPRLHRTPKQIVFAVAKELLIFKAPWLWKLVNASPFLRRIGTRLFVSVTMFSTLPRPYAYSLWGPGTAGNADYPSWTGLVDRSYTGRHLPPAASGPRADAVASLRSLFQRNGEMTPCPRSSALLCYFAQWFTDSFLRTDPNDGRRNTSNHEIDLCQIYGLSASDTRILRSPAGGGRLRTQTIDGEDFPPFLFEPNGIMVKPEFLGLSYIDGARRDYANTILTPAFNTPERKAKLFATGLERGNSTIFYSAINTVFLREHNRLCAELAKGHPDWPDDRLFETARNINIVQLLQIVVEDYISHLSPIPLKLVLPLHLAERKDWYRTNRIAAEFDLLYRWHPLVPTAMTVGGRLLQSPEFLFSNQTLIDAGLGTVIEAMATQRAGRIMLGNTAPFLVDADLAALAKSRAWAMRTYNEYRVCFGLRPMPSFEALTGEKELARELERLYGDIDDLEMPVGLLAEKHDGDGVLGDLMSVMVGVDAFSQALTNPLLASNIYGEISLAREGLQSVAGTHTFDDMVQRHARGVRRAAFDVAPAA